MNSGTIIIGTGTIGTRFIETDYPIEEDKSVRLAGCEHFTTNLISIEHHAIEKDYSSLDSFVSLLCTEGKAFIKSNEEQYDLQTGELILVPAITEHILINPLEKTKLLEVYI